MAEAQAPSLFNPPLVTLLPDFLPTAIYPLPSEVGRVEVSDVCVGYTTMEGTLINSKFVSYGVTVEMTLHTFNARKERLGMWRRRVFFFETATKQVSGNIAYSCRPIVMCHHHHPAHYVIGALRCIGRF
jgi:hypothetical protein